MGAKLAEQVFGSDLTAVRRNYLALAHAWHPDTSREPDPAPVFQKLSELYDDATARMKASLWPLQAVGVFEFGREFIGPTSVAWRFADPRDKERLAFRASGMLQSIGKAPARVRDEIAKQCPRGFAFHGGNVCTAKPSDMIRLADMKHHMCAPVHVAWLLSSLYSLCCGFDALGIVHAGIGPNTVYVSPSRHLAAVIGGWWHARSWGSDIDAVPRFTDRVLPWEVRAARKAVHAIDLECVRHIGRMHVVDAPDAMENFFDGCSSGSAIQDYAEWTRVLEACFGKKKFIRLNVTPEMIYG